MVSLIRVIDYLKEINISNKILIFFSIHAHFLLFWGPLGRLAVFPNFVVLGGERADIHITFFWVNGKPG